MTNKNIYKGSSLSRGRYYLRNTFNPESITRVFTSRIREVINETKAQRAGHPTRTDGKPVIFVENQTAGAGWFKADHFEMPEYYENNNNQKDLMRLAQLDQKIKLKNKQQSFADSFTMIAGMVTGETIIREDGKEGIDIAHTTLKIGDKIRVVITITA